MKDPKFEFEYSDEFKSTLLPQLRLIIIEFLRMDLINNGGIYGTNRES